MPTTQNTFAFGLLNSLVNIEIAQYNQRPKNKTINISVILLITSSLFYTIVKSFRLKR